MRGSSVYDAKKSKIKKPRFLKNETFSCHNLIKVFSDLRKLMNTLVFELTFKMREHGHTVFFIAAYFRNFRIAKIALDINRIAHISFHIKATNILQKNNPIFLLIRSPCSFFIFIKPITAFLSYFLQQSRFDIFVGDFSGEHDCRIFVVFALFRLFADERR